MIISWGWREEFWVIRFWHQQETLRLYSVLDQHLAEREFLAGDFSIADIANWCWVRFYKNAEIEIEQFPHVKRWREQIEARPASARGVTVPDRMELSKKRID